MRVVPADEGGQGAPGDFCTTIRPSGGGGGKSGAGGFVDKKVRCEMWIVEMRIDGVWWMVGGLDGEDRGSVWSEVGKRWWGVSYVDLRVRLFVGKGGVK